jgi:hypothetical protein
MKIKPLTLVERERISDSLQSVQSAKNSLQGFDSNKLPDIEEIQSCLKTADKSLRNALNP